MISNKTGPEAKIPKHPQKLGNEWQEKKRSWYLWTMADRSILFRSILATCFSLSGCALPERGYSTSYINVPGANPQCLRLVETKAMFENGPGEVIRFDHDEEAPPISEVPAPSAGTWGGTARQSVLLLPPVTPHRTRTNAQLFDIGWDSAGFIGQSDPGLCWAATLAMAFNHLGWKYQEAQFAEINREVCGMAATRSATLNQIIFALTRVHAGEGVWIADPDGQLEDWADRQSAGMVIGMAARLIGLPTLPPALPAPPPPPGGFMPIEWTTGHDDGRTTRGGVHPLLDTSDLLHAMLDKHPVVVGIERARRMHVIMIVSMYARPGGIMTGSGISLLPGETKIESVRYVDPLEGPATLDMSGDELLGTARFAFKLAA